MTTWLQVALLVCGSLLAIGAATSDQDPWTAEAGGRIMGQEVLTTLSAEGSASVMIMLTAEGGGLERPSDADIASLQNQVLQTLSSADFTLASKYQSVPALSGRLFPGGVAKLRENPLVMRVDLDSGGAGAERTPEYSADDR